MTAMKDRSGIKVGEKYGLLTVLSQAEPIKSISGKNRYKAWNCVCGCGNLCVIKDDTLKRPGIYLRSCGCTAVDRILNPENPDYAFHKLLHYVQTEVMGYGKDCMLSKDMILRIRGLQTGQFKANSRTISNAKYSEEVVQNTFRACLPIIRVRLQGKQFNDESHRFNAICSIVEQNLATVCQKMKKAEAAVEIADHNIPTQHDEEELKQEHGEQFQRAQEAAKNKRANGKKLDFDDMW